MTGLMRKAATGLAVGLFFFFIGVTGAHAQDYGAKVKTAMKMLQDKVTAAGTVTLDGTTLMFGAEEINGNYDIVDEVAEVMSCTATIFVADGDGYKRISTNVIKDGNRVIGTLLDSKGAAIGKIKAGESFYGQADILGSAYETGYEPLKDASGKVVGVLFCGYKL